MDKQQLFENIKRKKSFLCVGLDTDIKKIPEHLLKEEDPIFAFNKAIIRINSTSLTQSVVTSEILLQCMPAHSLKNWISTL